MSIAGVHERTNEEIVAEIQAGINAGKNRAQLFEQNKNFIRMYAKKYLGNLSDESTLQEYINEGYFALEKACENYRPETEAKFITALGYALQSHFGRCRAYNRPVRLPAYMSDVCIKCNRVKGQLYAQTGKMPSVEEIIAAAGLEKGEAESYRVALKTLDVRSLNEPITSENGEEMDLLQCIADDFDLEESAIDREHRENIKCLWNILPQYLTKNELEVVLMYYRDGLSGSEIAKRKGVLRQGIHEARRRALVKLADSPELAALLSV